MSYSFVGVSLQVPPICSINLIFVSWQAEWFRERRRQSLSEQVTVLSGASPASTKEGTHLSNCFTSHTSVYCNKHTQSHSPFPRRSCWHFQHTSCFAKFGALHYASHPHPSTHSAAFPISIQPINHRINGCFFSIPRRFRFGRVLIQFLAFVLLVFRSKQRPQTQTECLFPPFLTCLALNTRE